mmetsp:Transcript_48633/g.141753  ORF Transcript_48633/g.141753 Transcript_48633/m.141753 type:complete len:517 (-) Transcript_48633:51-1601(-)
MMAKITWFEGPRGGLVPPMSPAQKSSERHRSLSRRRRRRRATTAGSESASRCSAVSDTELYDSSRCNDDDEAVVYGKRQHLFTEALEENEELHMRIGELDLENTALRQKLLNMEDALHTAQSELRETRSMFEDPSAPTPSVAASTDAAFATSTDRAHRDEPDARNGSGERGDANILAHELAFLRDRCAQLERDVALLSSALGACRGQRQDDQALIQTLTAMVGRFQQVDAERAEVRNACSSGPQFRQPSDNVACIDSQLRQCGGGFVAGLTPLNALPRMRGHLLKRSPAIIRQLTGGYQRRFIAVEGQRLVWWARERDYPDRMRCYGSLDFSANECVLEADADDVYRFTLRPAEQLRVQGLALSAYANGLYKVVEYHPCPWVRYQQSGVDVPTYIFWSKGRWYIGADVGSPSHAVASKHGDFTREDLLSLAVPWRALQADERGILTVVSDAVWSAASFTGAHVGRVLEFSAETSEFPRGYWLDCLRQQLEAARIQRVSIQAPPRWHPCIRGPGLVE